MMKKMSTVFKIIREKNVSAALFVLCSYTVLTFPFSFKFLTRFWQNSDFLAIAITLGQLKMN